LAEESFRPIHSLGKTRRGRAWKQCIARSFSSISDSLNENLFPLKVRAFAKASFLTDSSKECPSRWLRAVSADRVVLISTFDRFGAGEVFCWRFSDSVTLPQLHLFLLSDSVPFCLLISPSAFLSFPFPTLPLLGYGPIFTTSCFFVSFVQFFLRHFGACLLLFSLGLFWRPNFYFFRSLCFSLPFVPSKTR